MVSTTASCRLSEQLRQGAFYKSMVSEVTAGAWATEPVREFPKHKSPVFSLSWVAL